MPKFKVRQSFTVHTVKEVELTQEEYDRVISHIDMINKTSHWDAELMENLGTTLFCDDRAKEVDHYDGGFYISGLEDCQTEIEYYD